MDKTSWLNLWTGGLVAWFGALVTYAFTRPAQRDATHGGESQRLLDYIERLQVDAARDATHRGDLERCVTSLRELVVRQGMELFGRRNERTHVLDRVRVAVELVESDNAVAGIAVLREVLGELSRDLTVPEIDLGE